MFVELLELLEDPPFTTNVDVDTCKPATVVLLANRFCRLVCWEAAAEDPSAFVVLTMKFTVAEPYWMLITAIVLICCPTVAEMLASKL